MLRFYQYTWIVMITLSLSSFALAEPVDDSPVDNKSTYHLSDSVDLITANDVQYAKPRVVIKLVFPKLSNSDDSAPATESANTQDAPDAPTTTDTTNFKVDAFNQLVAKTMQEEIDSFKQKVADAQSYQKTLANKKIKNRLTIDYSSAVINLEQDPLISIRFIVQGYASGMAHPYRHYRVVNFDMDSGTEIQLSEIFKPDSDYIEVITEYASKGLNKMLRGNRLDNSTLTADSFKNWNFNLNGLRITFDEATVAPAVYGAQSILIPYGDLQAIVNPESPFGQCLKHRKSCLRDYLLTGGFIDEAANTRHRRLNPVFG